jgi:hypothetical protein
MARTTIITIHQLALRGAPAHWSCDREPTLIKRRQAAGGYVIASQSLAFDDPVYSSDPSGQSRFAREGARNGYPGVTGITKGCLSTGTIRMSGSISFSSASWKPLKLSSGWLRRRRPKKLASIFHQTEALSAGFVPKWRPVLR